MKNREKDIRIQTKGVQQRITVLGLFFMLIFALTGCSNDVVKYPDIPDEQSDMVTFSIRIPQSSTPEAITRAMTGEQEREIREVDIFVFEPAGGVYMYNTSAKLITKNPEGSDADYRFTAMLEESVSCDIVLIANAHTAVQAFLTVQGVTPFTKNDLQTGLILENNSSSYFDSDGKWDTNSPALIPMWGETVNRQVVKEGLIEGVMLHRMVSRINLYVAADNFVLREVYLYNSVTKGTIIPDESLWDATWKPEGANLTDPAVGKSTAPSMPSGWGNAGMPLVYTYGNAEVKDKSCTNEIYTFETPVGDGTVGPANTFLVIGGLYDGSNTITYYRVDIVGKNQLNEDEYLPLLRNHTYEFTVNSVTRKGYASPDIAAGAGPENADVVLVIEHDSELRYYISDSHYYVGVTGQIVRLPYNTVTETNTLKIKTNYSPGWNVKVSASETNPDEPATWLTVDTSLPSTGDELNYTVSPNDGWAVRRAYLHISAGVEMVITIEQESQDNIELPVILPTGNIPAAGQIRTITFTGMFDTGIPVRVRDKYDVLALDSKTVPANAPGGLPVSIDVTIPAWANDDPRTLVFEYQDPGNSEWIIFHEDIQSGYEFEVSTSLMEGGEIAEKPLTGTDYTVTVSGSSWPLIYIQAIDRATLEVISDPVTVAARNDGVATTETIPVKAYGQWNDQAARIVELQWSKDGISWNTLCSGTQKGWYRITGYTTKIYHPATTERSDISHDGAKVVVTIEGDFPDGVVEVRLGSSDVQLERPEGDGISANTPKELICRYNRTILTRKIPLSYRIFVNNAWEKWAYEENNNTVGNIQTFDQPSITCEMPVTGRIIAKEDCLHDGLNYMGWASAMGIDDSYNTAKYVANVSAGDYPTYDISNGGCAAYYEGNDPNDPVRGQGKWFLWGDGKDEIDGEARFFTQTFSSARSNALGLEAGVEYWAFMSSPNPEYQMTLEVYENRWMIGYRWKTPLFNRFQIRARCVRYPTAEEKQQFENGYAPNVVTSY